MVLEKAPGKWHHLQAHNRTTQKLYLVLSFSLTHRPFFPIKEHASLTTGGKYLCYGIRKQPEINRSVGEEFSFVRDGRFPHHNDI
jgi:hypothetical protein